MKTMNNGRFDSVDKSEMETTREAAMKQTSAGNQEEPDEHLLEGLTDAMAAYEEVEPMLLALDEDDVRRLCVDAVKMAFTALAAVPRIEAFREQLAGLAKTEIADLEVLPTLAGAVWYLQGRVSKESRPEVRGLAEACFEHREKLVIGAQPLVYAGLMDADRIEPLGKRRGYLVVATELGWLADMYREA